MATEANSRQFARRFPLLHAAAGRLGAVSVVLAALGTMLGKAAEVKRYLFELLGPDALQSLHLGMSYLIATLFGLGYAALGYWFYRRFLGRQTRRRLYLALIVVLGVLITGCSLYVALPPAPDLHEILQREAAGWERELLGLRKEREGLRFSRSDHSANSQAWSTAQALWAVLPEGGKPPAPADAAEIRELLRYIESARLDGNEGWAYMQPFDWGVTEVNGWIVLAQLAALRPPVVPLIWAEDRAAALGRLRRDLQLLIDRQLPSGAWSPLADGGLTEAARSQPRGKLHERSYSTVIALWALVEAQRAQLIEPQRQEAALQATRGAVRWLLANYQFAIRSWVPNPDRSGNNDRYLGLSAQIIYVLERARPLTGELLSGPYNEARRDFLRSIETAGAGDVQSLAQRPVAANDHTHDSDVYLPGARVMVEGSTFLWYPWAINACSTRREMGLEGDDVDLAERGCKRLGARIHELLRFTESDAFTYVLAESLFGLRRYERSLDQPGVAQSR
jgi:hypothetical protein